MKSILQENRLVWHVFFLLACCLLVMFLEFRVAPSVLGAVPTPYPVTAEEGPHPVGVLPQGCTIAPGANSSYQQVFQTAYARQGGEANMGCAKDQAHWWEGLVVQDFEGGAYGYATIFHDENNQTDTAFVLRWKILDRYWHNSDWGPPLSDVRSAWQSPRGTNGYLADFWDMAVYDNGSGAWVIRGVTKTKYDLLDGSRGVLGFPTDDGRPARDSASITGGSYQTFEGADNYGGALHTYAKDGVWHAYATYGAILGKYSEMGGSGSAVGYPVNDVETATRSLYGTTGKMARFEDGDIYTSAKGTFVVRGVSKDTYNRLGGSGGVLGFPTMDGAPARDSAWTTGGWYQWFEGGMLHTYAKNGQWQAYETHGPILDKYNNMGGSASAIGYPINDVETAAPSPKGVTGYLARLEDGDIYTSAKGTFVIRGVTRTRYDSLGGSGGFLGFPENDGQPAAISPTGATGYYQPFEGGIMQTYEKAGSWRAYPVHGAIQAKYNSIGGSGSPLGFPTGDEADSAVSPAGTRGRYQEFERGQIYYHSSGIFTGASFVVSADFRDLYWEQGGSGGWLGLPVSDAPFCGLEGGRLLFEQGYIDCIGEVYMSPQTTKAKVTIEANYILSAQYRNSGHRADGALNDVAETGNGWTWVVPSENALALMGLILAFNITGNPEFRSAAERTAAYLVRIQDPVDGGWYNQYNYADPYRDDQGRLPGKSPSQAAEVMIALYKLGDTDERWTAMRRGAQFLLDCQKVEHKTGADDGLVAGGKDASGTYHTWRWTQDNAFAYHALLGAARWAEGRHETTLQKEYADAADAIRRGINQYLYDSTTHAWHLYVDASDKADNQPAEWGNYSPQMLDMPPETAAGTGTTGVQKAAVGTWIHNTFQSSSGAVKQVEGQSPARFSPGFSFQAALVWYDLKQNTYATDAIHWAETSGLWYTGSTPPGGWGDWVDDNGQRAEEWQRFIDTSFYAIAAWNGGYNFGTAVGTPVIDYGGCPSPFLDLPISYDRTAEGFARIMKNYSLGGKINSWFDHQYPNYDNAAAGVLLYTGTKYDRTYVYNGHNGLDFDMTGSALAAAAGRVVETWPDAALGRTKCLEGNKSCGYLHGNFVVLQHHPDTGNDYFTVYAHLSDVKVAANQEVPAGFNLGTIGNTGNSTGIHLHFGVYRDDGDGVWSGSEYLDGDGRDSPVDAFGWRGIEEDPWVRTGHPFSHELWTHSFTELVNASDQTVTVTDTTRRIKLTILPGTLAPSTSLALTSQPVPATLGSQRSSGYFFLTSVQASGAAVAAGTPDFGAAALQSQPIAVEVAYDAPAIVHLDESQLALHWWDETQQIWVPISSSVDPAQGRVTTLVTTYGQFDLQAPLRCRDQSEPNDHSGHAASMWANDAPIRQSLDGPQDVDWRRFYAATGGTYTISTSNHAPGVTTVLSLYAPNGEQLLLTASGTGVGSQLLWQALESGEYLVQVQPQPGSTTGCAAEYDLGITTDTGLVISIGSTAYDLRLTWQHNARYSGYRVFPSSTPYLSPSDPQQSEYIPASAADSEVSYVQSLASLPDRYFYLIAPTDVSGQPLTVAGRVGKFTFGLVTGSSDPPSGGGNNVAGSEFCSGLSVGEMASPSFKITAICGQAGILLNSDTAISPNYRHQPGLAGVLP